MSKNEYLVYVHIFPNGKQYVGMTKSAEKRWAGKGSNYKYNERMYKDIQKFGWDNIQHLILHSGLSKKRAFELEAEETEKRKSYLEEYGYNVSISNARSGERNPMYGMSGEKSPVAIPVHQYDKKTLLYIGSYPNALQASIELGIEPHINECCRGTRLSCGGYYWSYEKSEKYKKIRGRKEHTKMFHAVVQMDEFGNEIRVYSSLKEAARETGAKNISDCCRGVRNVSGGYKWRYLNDNSGRYQTADRKT